MRLSPFQAMAWRWALLVALFMAGSFLPWAGLAVAACAAADFTGSALWPTMLAVTDDRYPEGGATMFAALAALGNAGGIFLPWLAGVIAGRCGLPRGLAVPTLGAFADVRGSWVRCGAGERRPGLAPKRR